MVGHQLADESVEALPRDPAGAREAEDIPLDVLSSLAAPSVSDYPHTTAESMTSTSKLQPSRQYGASKVDLDHFDREGVQELERRLSREDVSGEVLEKDTRRISNASSNSGTMVGSLSIDDPESFDLVKFARTIMKK